MLRVAGIEGTAVVERIVTASDVVRVVVRVVVKLLFARVAKSFVGKRAIKKGGKHDPKTQWGQPTEREEIPFGGISTWKRQCAHRNAKPAKDIGRSASSSTKHRQC